MTDVLDLIDGAIRDWEIGSDAMRWTPDPLPVGPLSPPAPPLPTEMRHWLQELPPPPQPSYAPGTAEFMQLMPAICQWLTGNGFVPKRVPIDAVPVVSDRWIWCEVHVYDSAGRIVFDKKAGEVPTIVQRRPRRVDPPDVLWPWIRAGDIGWTLGAWMVRRVGMARMRANYARRLRHRRRR